MHRPVAGRERLRRDERQPRQQHPASQRPQRSRPGPFAGHGLGQADHTHHGYAEEGADQAQPGEHQIVRELQVRRGADAHHQRLEVGDPGHQRRRQGRGHHRGDVGDGIGADDDLEGVEGAGQRRAERRGDGGARPGADEGAQVAAAQVERLTGQGRRRAAHLGVARLQPHRGAEAVGDDGLQRHEQAVAQRHLAAAQGVGLDRVDRDGAAGARPEPGRQHQHRAAQRQGGQPPGVDPAKGAKPLVEVDVVEQLLQAVRGHADGDSGEARRGADEGGDQHQPQLAGPDLAAQEDQRLQRQARQPHPATAGQPRGRWLVGGDRLLVDVAAPRRVWGQSRSSR